MSLLQTVLRLSLFLSLAPSAGFSAHTNPPSSAQPVTAQTTSWIEALRQLAPELRPQIIVGTLEEMVSHILAEASGHPFTAHQFLGFSGANYLDKERLKAEFTQRALEINQETIKKLGTDAKTFYLLGATVDGFGVGYEILHALINSGALKNAVVMGMASNQAIKYHLEGLEKGWGAVISPHQKLVYMKETYADAQGNRSWELKSSETDESDTVKVLKDLSRHMPEGNVSFNVFGGGVQAFNETLEMIIESRNRPSQVRIHLNTGYLPGKPAKDTGYRASDMLVYVLYKNPFLLNDRIEVSVNSLGLGTTLSIFNYDKTPEYKKIVKDMAGNLENSSTLTADQIKAQENYKNVLQQLESLPLTELRNFRIRSSRQLAEARQLLQAGYRNRSLHAIQAGVDFCHNCAHDSETLLSNFNNTNACLINLTATENP